MTTAERIKQARLKAGLSKKELSEKYRIPLRSIQQWEEGSRKPPEYVANILIRCIKEDFSLKE